MDAIKFLQEHFALQIESVIQMDGRKFYITNELLYTIAEVSDLEQDWLLELHNMSEHLRQHGDKHASAFVKSKEGQFLITEEERDYVVLQNKQYPKKLHASCGKDLAKFHQQGRSLHGTIQTVTQFGSWRKLWQDRLDKMEKRIIQIIQLHPQGSTEKLLVDAFPYYSGLAENAIQYMMDTELDVIPELSDRGTVCHHQFYEGIWGESVVIHDPFEWMFDHPAKDISAWIRSSFWQGKLFYRSNFQKFLNDYQSYQKLSSFSWRLIYAQLLYPSHFFDCVEKYFGTSSVHVKKESEDELRRYVKTVPDYERFLAGFYQSAQISTRRLKIPEIIWLN